MIRERSTGVPYFAAYGPLLTAATDHAEADDANVRNPVGVVERVNAYGYEADGVEMGVETFSLYLWRILLPRVTHAVKV